MCVKRGEIYYADLRPVVGSEQGGIRPVLIIQNDVGNEHAPTVICAPITSRLKRMPTHIHISPRGGIYEDSTISLEQLRTIDKQRLKGKVAECTWEEMQKVDEKLIITLGMNIEIVELNCS